MGKERVKDDLYGCLIDKIQDFCLNHLIGNDKHDKKHESSVFKTTDKFMDIIDEVFN